MNEKNEMENNDKIQNNKYINLIGILLIMPIYMIFFVVLNVLNLNIQNNDILLPILMYLPIIVGIILSYKIHKNKTSKLISFSILLFIILAIYFYYNTYFIEYSGWDSIGWFLLWLGTTSISKILSCIFYGKIYGWKRGVLFLIIYIVTVGLSFTLGFWA